MKIHLITTVPSPYRIPLFNELVRQFGETGDVLKVIFLSGGYDRRKWKVAEENFAFRFAVLRDPLMTGGEKFTSVALSLLGILYRERPDVVIAGGLSFAAMWSAIYCRFFSKKFILWSGETLAEENQRTFRLARRRVRQYLFHLADAIVVYGSAARQFVESFGIPPSRIHVAINTVDTGFMRHKTDDIRRGGTNFGDGFSKDAVHILFIGYLEKRKGLEPILRAMSKIDLPLVLHVVGSGTEEETWKNLAQELLSNRVRFWGYRQTEEIPEFLAMADFLIFPSITELYGLVPIEAMAAGLPVLCSRRAGCAEDIIDEGVEGCLFDPLNEKETVEKITWMLLHKDERIAMGIRAQKKIGNKFSLQVSASGFVKAIQMVSS